MTKGYLLITKGPPQYFSMAVNMAASIRLFGGCDLPIFVACDKRCYAYYMANKDRTKGIEGLSFGLLIDDKKDNCDAKLGMYDYSPFDETVYFDVDSMVLNRFDFFGNPASVQFQTSGHTKLPSNGILKPWVPTANNFAENDYLKAFVGENITEMHSYYVNFVKNSESELFFDEAKQLKLEIQKGVTHYSWQGTVPDELPFSIASCLLSDLKINHKPVCQLDLLKESDYKYNPGFLNTQNAITFVGDAKMRKLYSFYDIRAGQIAKHFGWRYPINMPSKSSGR